MGSFNSFIQSLFFAIIELFEFGYHKISLEKNLLDLNSKYAHVPKPSLSHYL